MKEHLRDCVYKMSNEDEAKCTCFNAVEKCQTCVDINNKYGGFGPSHEGSKFCKSGSIASGGKNSHCTCDRCF